MAARRSKRVSVPSVADMIAKERRGVASASTPYEREILGRAASGGRSSNIDGMSGTGAAAQVSAQRNMSYETALAIQAAKEGDDSELLPYQPTPSINPPRPRTLAAGYDADTRTMRVRFRDGPVYAYYGVTPREWRNFTRVKSPGRAINRVFNHKPYARETWS